MLALDLTINGLIIGVFYALMAIGLSLIFGILKVVNFAHGEFYMVGAYTYTLGALLLGIPPWLALPLRVSGRRARRPHRRAHADAAALRGLHVVGVMRDEYAVIVTFGLSLLLDQPGRQESSAPTPTRARRWQRHQRITIGPILISGHRLVAAVLAIAVIVVVMLVVRYSYWGRQIQAVAQNRLGASLAGIDTGQGERHRVRARRRARRRFPARCWPTSSIPRRTSAFSRRSSPT